MPKHNFGILLLGCIHFPCHASQIPISFGGEIIEDIIYQTSVTRVTDPVIHHYALCNVAKRNQAI
jgi:hypothetical protein